MARPPAVRIGSAIPSNPRGRSVGRATSTSEADIRSYDYYLRGTASLHRGTREAVNEALPLFHKAIQIDPDFASAYAMAAWCHLWRKLNGWMTDRLQEFAEGARLARRALELGKDDAVALARTGGALCHFVGDLDSSIALIDRALALNPNLTAAWYTGG